MIVMEKASKMLENRRVLLIEDDEVDSLMLKFMVENQGGEIVQEDSCQNAYDVIKKQDFDLLILDTRLQHTNTIEIIRDLRSNADFKLPAIGLASKYLSGRALQSGFDAMLFRPLDQARFLEALSHVSPKLP